MQVIGVLDLLGGCAVHACGGARERYKPVTRVSGSTMDAGDPVTLARAYVERLGIEELYVADLDAILDRPPQDASIAAVAAVAPTWLDAGVASAGQARRALSLHAAHVVVGLETLGSYDALAAICGEVGGDRVAFSLDLRDGQPAIAPAATIASEPAHRVAARAARAGVGAVIVLDLARVGASAGLDLELIQSVREAAPAVTLLAGGGVRGLEDLARLADAGCDGALVATALHDGRLGAADVAAARRLGHGHRAQ